MKVSVEVAIPKEHADSEIEVREIIRRKREETSKELLNLFQTRSHPG